MNRTPAPGCCLFPATTTCGALQGDPDQIAAIYDRYVQDEHCLCGRDVVLGDRVFIGDVGWYDYSFGSGRYSLEEFEKMSLAGRTWQDSLRNAWTRDNLGRTQWMLSRLEARMAAYPDKKLILITHMLPIKDFTVPQEKANWSYFNAFLGSRKFGELYRRYPVEAAVCGHVHYRRSVDKYGIHWMCRCLNYHSEWRPQTAGTRCPSRLPTPRRFWICDNLFYRRHTLWGREHPAL